MQLNGDLRYYPTPSRSGRWTAKAVRRIVSNIKYTGRQVWARTADGRPAPVEVWVISRPKVHEPLVDERTFTAPRRAATASRPVSQYYKAPQRAQHEGHRLGSRGGEWLRIAVGVDLVRLGQRNVVRNVDPEQFVRRALQRCAERLERLHLHLGRLPNDLTRSPAAPAVRLIKMLGLVVGDLSKFHIGQICAAAKAYARAFRRHPDVRGVAMNPAGQHDADRPGS